MTGPNDRIDEFELDALFEEARGESPTPSDDLVARIVQDAAQMQPKPASSEGHEPTGVFRQFLAAIGGWPALGGLATAAITGVYIGVAQPGLVGVTAAELEDLDYVSTEIWPSDDLFFEEG